MCCCAREGVVCSLGGEQGQEQRAQQRQRLQLQLHQQPHQLDLTRKGAAQPPPATQASLQGLRQQPLLQVQVEGVASMALASWVWTSQHLDARGESSTPTRVRGTGAQGQTQKTHPQRQAVVTHLTH